MAAEGHGLQLQGHITANHDETSLGETKIIAPSGSDADALTYTIDEVVAKGGFGPFQWKLLFLCGIVWSADASESCVCFFSDIRVRP